MFEKAEKEKKREINAEFDSKVSVFLSGYPQLEAVLFPFLTLELIAYDADSAAKTTMVETAIAITGETKESFMASLRANRDPFLKAAGDALGHRRRAAKELSGIVDDGGSKADIEAVGVGDPTKPA